MAGGIGTRFWPISTPDLPKQFQDILGIGKTMIQQTYDRALRIVPENNIYVITNKELVSVVRRQLPNLNESQIIGEPERKSTGPCNLYMALKIFRKNPESCLFVAPSDHLILNEVIFEKKLNLAFEEAFINHNLVTIGIRPTRPETGYGYIQFKPEEKAQVQNVVTFTEKPNLNAAKDFLEAQTYLWNSGMFIWRPQDILNAFEQFLPDMYKVFSDCAYNQPEEADSVAKAYHEAPEISIDKAILEKAQNVKVVPADLGWSDLGTWTSLFEQAQKDKNNNVDTSTRTLTYKAKGNIIRIEKKDKVAIIDGLNDYIIVDTEKALLICPRSSDQEIKRYVSELYDQDEEKELM